MPTLEHIAIYPIKGFPSVNLVETSIRPNRILPEDRRFSFALKCQDTADVKWLSKGKLLQILNTNLLSGLNGEFVHLSDETWQLNVKSNDVEQFFALPEQGDELARFLSQLYGRDLSFLDGSSDIAFADQKTSLISLLNLASVEDMAQKSGQPISWQRLRGNLMVDGLPAWQENELVGAKISVGDAEFEVVELVCRCAAPGVNLQGQRDIDLLDFMLHSYDHTDCGLFLKALNTADITKGDPFKIL